MSRRSSYVVSRTEGQARECQRCGAPYTARRDDARYCSSRCATRSRAAPCRCGCGQTTSAPWVAYLRGHRPKARLEDRLAAKRRITESGCWEFTGYVGAHGYGEIGTGRGREVTTAHRAAWQVWRGPIPDGLHLDHLCRNRACFNPDHLEPVTPAENSRRAHLSDEQCKHGHPRTKENTYVRPDGSRECRDCHRVADSRWREVNRGRKRAA